MAMMAMACVACTPDHWGDCRNRRRYQSSSPMMMNVKMKNEDTQVSHRRLAIPRPSCLFPSNKYNNNVKCVYLTGTG